jgi:hypothetical protein
MLQHYPSFSDINTFLLFVGYPRSGHSLVGALLNAHPQAIVSHELDAVARIKDHVDRDQLFKDIVDKEAAFKSTGSKWSGYSYQVASTSLEQEYALTHIGDKRGGTTSKHLLESWTSLDAVLGWGLKLKILHVVRNPYDCVSTAIRKREAKQGRVFQSRDVIRKIDHFIEKADVISQLINSEKYDIYTLKLEELIVDTETELNQLLHFVELPINDQYLANCQQLVWDTPSQPRFQSPHWSTEHKTYLKEKMAAYPFLQDYTFES